VDAAAFVIPAKFVIPSEERNLVADWRPTAGPALRDLEVKQRDSSPSAEGGEWQV